MSVSSHLFNMKWSSNLTKELFKQNKNKFKRRRVECLFVDQFWATDLLDLQKFAKTNKGYKYILVVIDCFSKFAWLRPLKTKQGNEVAKALEDIIQSNDNKSPYALWSDRGKEYYNSSVKKILDEHNIIHYSTFNTEKVTIAERFNRTIVHWLYLYFDTNGTNVWYNILNDLENRYNKDHKHRSIGMSPVNARLPSNYQRVLNKLNFPDKRKNKEKASFRIGDKVRISTSLNIFDKKSASKKWTEELFEIDGIRKTVPITYTIKDLNGEKIKGTFYKEELQKTLIKNNIYRIEKILAHKTVKGQKKLLIRWKGYNASFDSWVPKQDVETKTRTS